jgi:hypothetical protein
MKRLNEKVKRVKATWKTGETKKKFENCDTEKSILCVRCDKQQASNQPPPKLTYVIFRVIFMIYREAHHTSHI